MNDIKASPPPKVWAHKKEGKKNMETINIGTIKTWNIEAMTGYKPRTTFYEDFSIAGDMLMLKSFK